MSASGVKKRYDAFCVFQCLIIHKLCLLCTIVNTNRASYHRLTWLSKRCSSLGAFENL